MPRYLVQRVRQYQARESLVAGAVVSLNALNRSRAGRRLVTEPACRGLRPGVDADVWDSVLRNLGRATGEFLPKPAEHAVCAGGALRELLKSRDIYDFSPGAHTARYDPDLLTVLRRQSKPMDARLLLDGDALEYLRRPEDYIMLGDDDLQRVGDPIVPHWDQQLGSSKQCRRNFIKRLDSVGLITWRRRVRCTVGCFFVAKKDDSIRLVVDCRPVNQLRRRSPKTHLSTPGALSHLNMSQEWANFTEAADRAVDGLEGPELDVHRAIIDFKDGFHQFSLQELASWFRLWERYTADEDRIASCFCDEAKCDMPIGSTEEVEACL